MDTIYAPRILVSRGPPGYACPLGWSRRARVVHEDGPLGPTASASLVTQEPPRRARLQTWSLRAQIAHDAGCPLGLNPAPILVF